MMETLQKRSIGEDSDIHNEKRKWFKKRRILACFTLLMQCLIYFEYSAVSISALYYYKEDLQVGH